MANKNIKNRNRRKHPSDGSINDVLKIALLTIITIIAIIAVMKLISVSIAAAKYISSTALNYLSIPNNNPIYHTINTLQTIGPVIGALLMILLLLLLLIYLAKRAGYI